MTGGSRIGIILLVSAVLAYSLPRTAHASGELADRLLGTWLVTVGNDPKTRTLDVRSVDVRTDGTSTIDAYYGYTAKKLDRVDITARIQSGTLSIEFLSPAKSHIRAASTAERRMLGTFTSTKGKEHPIAFVPADADELVKSRNVVTRKSTIMLIYIGAENCGFCKRWEAGYGANTRAEFLESLEGKTVAFREIQTNNFMDTGDLRFWPDDLTWIRDRTYVLSGTPRYVIVLDGRVVMNQSGLRNWREKIRPRLQDLAAQKNR